MFHRDGKTHRGFTLMELILVVAMLALLAGFALPTMYDEIARSRMPDSAEQMRALIRLTRGHAMFDGKRYRIRFMEEEEALDAELEEEEGVVLDPTQPVIEVEREPLRQPGVFEPVRAAWAHGKTLRRGIRCIEVRLGKPTLEQLIEEDTERHEMLVDELGEEIVEDEYRPPVYIEPDGTMEWVTFVLTDAPPEEAELEEEIDREEYEIIWVIVDGLTGQAWLQRPFHDEELDMLLEHNWPPVLRRDFLDKRLLTEDDVIEIQERTLIRQ